MDLFLISALFVVVSNSNQAQVATLQAYGKQSGIERMLDDWQQREVSPALRTGIGDAAFLVKTIVERHVAVEWRF